MHLGQKGFETMKTQSFGLDPRFFCGINFSRSFTPNDVMMDIPNNHILGLGNDGNPIMVSIVASVTRVSSHVPKP
jgi:hypothetical protein